MDNSSVLSRRGKVFGFAGLVMALAAIAWAAWSWSRRPGPDPDPPSFPIAPISSSPFLNTKAEVKYVGSDRCMPCHQGDTMNFRRTGMGHSTAPIDLDREPPDATFDHVLSKRRYHVQRRDGQLWHREMLLAGGDAVLLQEFPVKYVVGSGRHSLTYLVETDGFLVESPVTWYASRKAWGMSPGYDTPNHSSFERATGEGCLNCHAGRAEAIDGSLHRMRVIEPAISCERCHGPGALHVERHAGNRPLQGEMDHTIVNPRHLSRALAEAVCQQCHLRSSATIIGRGRHSNDFRPGLPLQDFRQDYVLENADRPMTVVGHVEQLHLSRCYQKSDKLTCMTCHNPHAEPKASERERYYNARCANCHQPETCTVAPDRRAKGNNCVDCHMPRAPTEIPHLAFTHHRIGIHDKRAVQEDAARPGVLKPFLDVSRFSDIDQKRSLGLGYLETANRERDRALSEHYRRHAFDLLKNVRQAGLRDAALQAALARLHFELRMNDAETHAASALALPDLAAQDRCNVLYMLADGHAKKREYTQALPMALELTKLRRHPFDWILVAECRKHLDGPSADIAALEQATRINPRLWEIQRHLAEHYRREGDAKKAAWHEARAAP